MPSSSSYSDPRMASDLIKRVQGKPEGRKLEVIVNDVMKQELPPVDVCISNTPYQVSLSPRKDLPQKNTFLTYTITDLLPARLQASFTAPFAESLCTHVPKRICPASGSEAG